MGEPVIDENLSKELEGYKGKWVAIDQASNKVVGSGPSLLDAQTQAQEKGITDPILYRVPAHPERLAFY